jgi:hypothetical protein
MGCPDLTEAIKWYKRVIFLDTKIHGGAKPSYAGAERWLTGRGCGRRQWSGDVAAGRGRAAADFLEAGPCPKLAGREPHGGRGRVHP